MRAVSATFAVGLLALVPACSSTVITFRIEFQSVVAKTMPTTLDDEGTARDVKVANRSKFKEPPGSAGGPGKRLRMKAKHDDAAVAVASEREVTGDVSTRVRVTVSSTTGLVDGQSLGFLERRPSAGGVGPVQRVEAVWTAAIGGFTTRYLEDGVVVGVPLAMNGVTDVHLFLTDTGGSVEGQAAAAIGGGLNDVDTLTTFGAHTQIGTDETATVAFGCNGLDAGGAIYFTQLALIITGEAMSGDAETAVIHPMGHAWQDLDAASAAIHAGSTDLGAIAANVQTAATLIDDGATLLDQAVTQGTLLSTTDAPDAQKNFQHAKDLLGKANAKLTALVAANATSASSVQRFVDKARASTELILAELVGFGSRSHGKLDDSVKFTLL